MGDHIGQAVVHVAVGVVVCAGYLLVYFGKGVYFVTKTALGGTVSGNSAAVSNANGSS